MAGMDKARWERVSPWLDELFEVDAAQRADRLARLRAENATLADEVAALLAQQAAVETADFLGGSPLGPQLEESLAGKSVGAYTLVRSLGAGGMGTVWLARRSDGRYEGQAAVKFLNLALLGHGGAERFRREGSALARLTHPNVAHLIDAGVAAGQPYLVLEYVDGTPIDRWCDAQRLDAADRIRLFLQVLAAVTHAHGRLILHRDLKPSNILVTADGQIKLLDFGIAKLLETDGQAGTATELTQLAGRAFTPEFAAPEQVQGDEATIATDVYALGVLLYLLLAGTHPTATAASTPVQRMQALIEAEPARLSDAVLAASVDMAPARASSPAQLARALRGDLDNIVAKALKKAPGERYATVDALAGDLRRYLNDEPVSARPDSFGYRLGKFVRRYRLAVGAATATILALAAGLAGTAWQAYEARLQREQAIEQRDRARALLGRNEAIVDFVDMMFTEALPAEQVAAFQQMLERSEALIDSAFVGQPMQQAELLRVLTSYYTVLNLPEKQIALTARALKIVEGSADVSVKAQLACAHAAALGHVGRLDEANALLDQWIRARDVEASIAAVCLQTRAVLAQGVTDSAAALRFAEAGLQRLREAQQPPTQLEASLLGDVGFALHLAGRNREADRHYQQALDRLRALGRHGGSYSRRLLIDRGLVRYAMGDFNSGLQMLDEAIGLAQKSQGNAPIPPAMPANRAFGLEQLGRYDEAIAAYDQAFDAAERSGFPAGKAYAAVGRANVLATKGDVAGAQSSLARAAALMTGIADSHPVRIRHTLVQARVDMLIGRLAEADAGFTAMIKQMSAQGLSHPALANAYRQRAEVAWRRGALPLARDDAERALELARKLQGENEHSDLTGLAWLTLGQILRDSRDNERAHAAFQQAEENLLSTVGSDHPDTRLAHHLLTGA